MKLVIAEKPSLIFFDSATKSISLYKSGLVNGSPPNIEKKSTSHNSNSILQSSIKESTSYIDGLM